MKETHIIQKIQRIINFLKVSFSHFCLCMESSQKSWTPWICVLKILFDIREARGGWRPRRFNLESISKYEKVNQESVWKGTLCNWAWHVFAEISKLQAPQSCKHARQYNGALCSDPHGGPWVCYSCIWYCTPEQAQKASMIIERKHKEWMGACSATKQRAVYPSC